MNPEEQKKQKEAEAQALREKADAAHEKAANDPGNTSLQEAADKAEDLAVAAQAEADAIVITPTDPPKDGEEGDKDDKDIDFEEELRRLEGGKPPETPPAPASRSELEKAERSLHFNAERVKKLGGDPSKIIQAPAPKDQPPAAPSAPAETSEFVTRDDFAREKANKLARNEAEAKVIMYHYKNSIKLTGDIDADIANAHILANRGRIQRSFAELKRQQDTRIPTGGGPGRGPKMDAKKAPELPRDQQAALKRRGFKMNPDGSWEGRRYVLEFESGKGWIEKPKPPKK